jgi:hypothetical protein
MNLRSILLIGLLALTTLLTSAGEASHVHDNSSGEQQCVVCLHGHTAQAITAEFYFDLSITTRASFPGVSGEHVTSLPTNNYLSRAPPSIS